MRWAPHYSPQMLLLGLGMLLLLIVVMLAAAPDLSTLDFSIGGGGETATPVSDAPFSLPVIEQGPAPAEPTWVSDPLAPPIDVVSGR
jgi:hypothetical protein